MGDGLRLMVGWYGLAGFGRADLEREYQVRLVVSFCSVAVVVATLFAVQYQFSFHFAEAALVLLGVAAGYALVPLLLRATGRADLAGHAIAALLAGVAVYLGTLRPTYPVSSLMYLAALPLVVTPLSGWRAAVGWVLVCSVVALGFVFWVHYEWAREAFPADPTAILEAESSGVVGLAAVVLAVSVSTERARRRLDQSRRRLHRRLTQELESLVQARTAELRAANRELEALAYSIAHDLRAPLRGMDGFGAALEEDCGGQLDEHGRDHVRRIRSNARHLATLLDELLELSRVARAKLEVTEVDLSDLADQTLAWFRASQPERRVEARIAPRLRARGDRTLLRIVLEHLIGNAWKFSRVRDVAHIEVGETEVDGERAYFVRDDGAGFDMTYAKKLFRPFERLHDAHEFPGTGVGLATVQRAIERHGGRVWLAGAVNEGTVAYFTLPERPPSEPASPVGSDGA